ncbi:MAG: exodeoxyribonuclease VII small subunit [Bacteroidetes bacterium]|nr:exodeoxyribonuclease VII small subunit [Bacteroidota bacterium]
MVAKKSEKNSLEHYLQRLQEIAESLEQGEVPLDEAVNLYEEGIKLSKECTEKLKTAELKIKKLSKGIEDQLALNETEEE